MKADDELVVVLVVWLCSRVSCTGGLICLGYIPFCTDESVAAVSFSGRLRDLVIQPFEASSNILVNRSRLKFFFGV